MSVFEPISLSAGDIHTTGRVGRRRYIRVGRGVRTCVRRTGDAIRRPGEVIGVLVEAVAVTDEDITTIAERNDELDLETNDENLVRAEYTNPIDHAAIVEPLADEG